jgi:two-component system chemotaxis response regulator CheB
VTTRTVLVVDSGGGAAGLLEAVLQGRGLEPVTSPVAPALAFEAVRKHEPHLVIVEVREASPEIVRLIERVMSDHPRPVVLVVRTSAARQVAFSLLDAGALDVLSLDQHPSPAAIKELHKQLVLLSSVRVGRHPRGRKRRTSSTIPAVRPDFHVVAIAASLGGPKALAEVLDDIPGGFPAPVVICQHITPGFSDDLARWLASETGHRVHEASDGQRLVKGEFYVAPSHLHLLVSAGGVIKLDDGPPVGGFKPSCDVMLRSVAQGFGARAVGVVLTGMGSDGAKGLKEIRAAGGHTIAQDRETSIVFGMPGQAVALGAAELVLPLDRIGEQLARWVS